MRKGQVGAEKLNGAITPLKMCYSEACGICQLNLKALLNEPTIHSVCFVCPDIKL